MVFLEIVSFCVKQIRSDDSFKFFENFSGISEKEKKHSNSEKLKILKIPREEL